MHVGRFRWRKTTDIQRDYALFELVEVGSDLPLLDVGFSDVGELEVSFNSAIVGKTLNWDQLFDAFRVGKELAEKDHSES